MKLLLRSVAGLALFVFVSLDSFILQTALAESPRQSTPNFIFILIDDLGWSDLECYGSTFYQTPHIDKLAAQGMKFSKAYASAPVCSPTRASILTGRYP